MALLRPAGQVGRRAFDERDAVAGLVRDPSRPPSRPSDRSTTRSPSRRRSSSSTQGSAEDPTTASGLQRRRGRGRPRRDCDGGKGKPPPRPRRWCPASRPARGAARGADGAGESLLADDGRFAACRALLRREPPRLTSGALGEDVDSLVAATLALDDSILPVQGPPGTGKTYRGARMIVAALRAGRRVGITAQSHAAIQNMLREVEKCAGDGLVRGRLQGRGLREPAGPGRDDRRQRRCHSRPPARGAARRGCSPAPSTARRSTCSSSTRPASSRSPTPRPSARPRGAWCSSATPSSSPR